MCHSFGFHVLLEVFSGPSAARPADVLLSGVWDEHIAIDVAVIHALHHDLPSAARDNKRILSMTEDSKRQQSQRLYRTAGWNVGPFVATTMGAWGPAAQSLMNRVAKAQALRTGILFQEMARETSSAPLSHTSAGAGLPALSHRFQDGWRS